MNAGDFAKAAALQASYADMVEKAESGEANGKPGTNTANALFALSWYRLFAKDYKGAVAASDRATALQPDAPIYAADKAHALMFLGRSEEARALYLCYKGQPVYKDGKLWEAAILDDFKEFGKYGLKHPQMAEIKALFSRN